MKSLILIFIALGCGLVASIGISQVMNRDSGGGTIEMEQILVALNDVDIGIKLDAQNVKLEDWPKTKVPEGAIRRLEDVKDKFANVRFFKGEPLNVNKISDTLKNIAVQVPQGYRAMPVKIEEDTVMKAVSPGDRVDVMVFLRRNGQDITETGAFTILKNVRVFAINTNTERASDSKGETTNFRTVSLLVKPDHARELVVAAQMGKIMLTLRRPDEIDELTGEEVTPLAEILSGRAKNASETTGSSNAGGFMQVVKDAIGTAPPAAALPAAVEPAWRMDIMGPAERKRYEWTDLKELPQEMTVGHAAIPPGAPAASATTKSSDRGPESLENPDKPGAISAPDAESKEPTDGKTATDGKAATDGKTLKDGKSTN
jgi:pilus assembly protein CpaB